MIKCSCGNNEFVTTKVTKERIRVTTESGYPVHISETEQFNFSEFTGLFICTKCEKGYLDIGDTQANKDPGIKKCVCGNTRFSAHQVCYHDVVVDSNNIYDRNVDIGEAENPYGPYRCTECGAEYEELGELDKFPINKEGNAV